MDSRIIGAHFRGADPPVAAAERTAEEVASALHELRSGRAATNG